MRLRTSWVVLAAAILGAAIVSAQAPSNRNVVLVTLDGARWQGDLHRPRRVAAPRGDAEGDRHHDPAGLQGVRRRQCARAARTVDAVSLGRLRRQSRVHRRQPRPRTASSRSPTATGSRIPATPRFSPARRTTPRSRATTRSATRSVGVSVRAETPAAPAGADCDVRVVGRLQRDRRERKGATTVNAGMAPYSHRRPRSGRSARCSARRRRRGATRATTRTRFASPWTI